MATATSPETAAFMRDDPQTAVSRTNDPSSFAYPTARERWPRIFNQIVEDISNASKSLTNDQDREIGEELKAKITSLKDGMLNNATLSLLSEDGDPDIPDYNAELTAQGDPTWLNGPWLFIECYQYRVVYQIFRESGSLFWQEYDMFASSKRNGLIGSKKGTLELIRRFHALRSSLDEKAIDEDTPKLLFEEMVQISLWGNATDLSLLGSVSVSQLDSLQGKKARDAAKANVLADDTAAAFALLSSLRQGGKVGEIHYVLDNAGFELLTDLVLAWFLLASGYCNKMILHGKRMPWFVSDVNEHDLKDLLAALSDPNFWPDLSDEEKADLNEAAGQWRVAFDDGKMEYRAHPFWTTGHSFGRMHIVAPKLYDQLSSATLTLFKGDLNYRKLTYDGRWPHSTPFSTALGPFAQKHDGKGVCTLVLRTAKADVAVGIAEEKLKGLPADWTRSGEWGMVQFWDGKGGK